jgi:hypothetical protein
MEHQVRNKCPHELPSHKLYVVCCQDLLSGFLSRARQVACTPDVMGYIISSPRPSFSPQTFVTQLQLVCVHVRCVLLRPAHEIESIKKKGRRTRRTTFPMEDTLERAISACYLSTSTHVTYFNNFECVVFHVAFVLQSSTYDCIIDKLDSWTVMFASPGQ